MGELSDVFKKVGSAVKDAYAKAEPKIKEGIDKAEEAAKTAYAKAEPKIKEGLAKTEEAAKTAYAKAKPKVEAAIDKASEKIHDVLDKDEVEDIPQVDDEVTAEEIAAAAAALDVLAESPVDIAKETFEALDAKTEAELAAAAEAAPYAEAAEEEDAPAPETEEAAE
jgi:hypothetical protein